MDWMNKVTGILQQYSGNPAAASADNTEVQAHYDSVAKAAPTDVLAQGLSAAFKSDQTPAFGQMVSTLFQNSSPEQKSGFLNQFLATAGPTALAKLFPSGNQPGAVTSGTVNQLSPEEVGAAVAEAHQTNPSIVESLSEFYAQHPTLVKTLGAAALSVVMSNISHRKAA